MEPAVSTRPVFAIRYWSLCEECGTIAKTPPLPDHGPCASVVCDGCGTLNLAQRYPDEYQPRRWDA